MYVQFFNHVVNIPLAATALLSWADVVQVLLVLLLLAPLVYVVTKLYGKRSPFGAHGRLMRIVESVSVGPGRAICLVEVPGNRFLVVGVTAQQINVLTELNDPQIAAEIRASQQGGTGKERFAAILQRFGAETNAQEGESSREGPNA